MLSIDEALARVLHGASRLGVEEVGLAEAYGRVLAHDLRSPRDVPPWPNSAMDGYAVRASDTRDGEYVLRVNEVIAAGRVGTIPVAPGTASAIMTGAPLPPGADAVVMVERSDGAREGVVQLRGGAEPGEHVRPQGGDVRQGEVILLAGRELGAAAVGLVASLGIARVSVGRRPVVAILTTGDEVVQPGSPLGPGQIYSSNNFCLVGQVLEAGGIPRDLGNAPDDPAALVARLREAADADVIVTTGGVSMGFYDFVRDAMDDLGVAMDFWKVRMKPGKPLAFGRLEREGRAVPLFGLPGNPVSCMVNFAQFVRPWVRIALGDLRPFLPVLEAFAGEDLRSSPGRAQLVRVGLTQEPRGLVARSTGDQSSGVLTSMARAHGLLLVPADSPGPAAGDRVRVQLLDPGFLAGETPGYGW